jgi:hypothetical protein
MIILGKWRTDAVRGSIAVDEGELPKPIRRVVRCDESALQS